MSGRAPLLGAFAFVVTLLAPAPGAIATWTGPCTSGIPLGAAPPICKFWNGKLKYVDDGDTIDVKLPTSTGKRKTVRVRMTGIQAMEQSVYNTNPRKRRGDCHALPATARLEQLIRQAKGRVRLGAQDDWSASGTRLRRSVAARIRGKWKDVGRILLAEGHALWLPNLDEYAWNVTYSTLAQQAAAARLNLWNPTACGIGPSQEAALRVTVNADAPGDDFENVNGEWVRIDNLGAGPVPLGGWWVRDSSLRRFTFPAWVVIPPGGNVTVLVGTGVTTPTTLYWGLETPIFDNARPDGRGNGDGAYLFDPQGDLRSWTVYPCYVNCAT